MRNFQTSLIVSLLLALASTAASAQCSKDTDCKGDRICVKGACTSPAPATPAAAATPVPAPSKATTPSSADPGVPQPPALARAEILALYQSGQGELARAEAGRTGDVQLEQKLGNALTEVSRANVPVGEGELNKACIRLERALDLDQELGGGAGPYRQILKKALAALWVRSANNELIRQNPQGARSALTIALTHDPDNVEARTQLTKLNWELSKEPVKKPVRSVENSDPEERPAPATRRQAEDEENGYDRWRRGDYDGEDHRGMVPVRRARGGLIAAGSVMLGIGYLTSAIVGLAVLGANTRYATCSNTIGFSLIPLFGTYIALGSYWASGCPSGATSESVLLGSLVAIVFGVLQDLGLTLLIVGSATKSTSWVRKDEVEVSWDLSPVGPGGLPGASFHLRF